MSPSQSRLPRTWQRLEEGRREGLHFGAQLSVWLREEEVADFALGEDRPGVPLTPYHLMLWLSTSKPVTRLLSSSRG